MIDRFVFCPAIRLWALCCMLRSPCTWLVFYYMFIKICPALDPGFNSRKLLKNADPEQIFSEPLCPAKFLLHVYRDMTRTRSGFEFLKNCLGNADPELFARGPCTWLFFCDMFTEISPAPGLGLNSQKSAEECVSRVILFWNPCAQSKFFFTWLYKKYLNALQTLFVYSKRKTDMLNTEQKMYLS